jgi:hypothetical protein
MRGRGHKADRDDAIVNFRSLPAEAMAQDLLSLFVAERSWRETQQCPRPQSLLLTRPRAQGGATAA